MDITQALQIFVEKIEKDYKDDISIVVMMGSRIYRDTHAKSDVDFYYIPKTDRGNNLAFVGILEGIGYDYWPISWERMEKIANWDERIVSILTDGYVVYCPTRDDLVRFLTLRKHALSPKLSSSLKEKAQKKFKDVYPLFFDLCQKESLSDFRIQSIKIIYHITEVIAMYNQKPIKRGRKFLKNEILKMPIQPKGFSDLYDAVFISKDMKYIKKALHELILRVEDMFNSTHESQQITPFVEQAFGFYEEIINHYNKIERACEIGDPYTALFAACEIEFEFEWLFKHTDVKKELPDLVGYYHQDELKQFAIHAKEHQQALYELLISHGVKIREFSNIEELELFIQKL